MLIEYDTFAIGAHFVPAIINDDYTGLTDEEEKELHAFLDKLPDGYKCWEWSVDVQFCRDDVNGLMADCKAARLYMNYSDI